MEELIVDCCSCNDKTFTVLDLSSFVNLRVFEVGDYSFAYVNEVKLIGLHALESVVIGQNSFRKSGESDPNRHFYLKDCEKLKELKIGCYSFADFTMCMIRNVPSLEVIEVGELNQWSDNFYYASLILESGSDGMK